MIQAEKLKTYDPTKFKPGYMSVKRNGVHGIYDSGLIYSRTPKKIEGLEHIELALKPFKYPIAFEITIPGLYFETASGLIRSSQSTPGAEIHIFNSIAKHTRFIDRNRLLQDMKHIHYRNHMFVHFESMQVCNTKEQFDEFYRIQTEVYKEEGVCWISPEHVYTSGARQWNWMKRVPMKSIEVEIVEILPGTPGKKYERSMGKMQCKFTNELGEEKLVKVGIFKGQTDEWRQKIWNDRIYQKGKSITIEFKDYSKYGIPTQVRFKSFRWDI